LLVGNDVVDLVDPGNQPGVIHPRFDARVFTSAERAGLAEHERLRGEAAAHRLRWSLWAAKESAFKAARKLDEGVRFLPKRFSVRFTGGVSAVVGHVDVRRSLGRFDVAFLGAGEWVHAIARHRNPSVRPSEPGTWPPEPGERHRVSAVVERIGPAATPLEASERVRALARRVLGRALAIAPSEIEVIATGRIPEARWRDAPLPVDLSLSHHGRFLACALSSPLP